MAGSLHISWKDGELVRDVIMVLAKTYIDFSIMYGPKDLLCVGYDLDVLKDLVRFVRAEAEKKAIFVLRS